VKERCADSRDEYQNGKDYDIVRHSYETHTERCYQGSDDNKYAHSHPVGDHSYKGIKQGRDFSDDIEHARH